MSNNLGGEAARELYDELQPLIMHHFDDFGEKYNYITYRFEGEKVIYTARMELFSHREVALAGPYAKDTLLPTMEDEIGLREKAREYLCRRFWTVNG